MSLSFLLFFFHFFSLAAAFAASHLPLCICICLRQRGKCEAANAAQVKKSEKRKVKMRETIGVLCILFISCRWKNCNILNNDDNDENDDDEWNNKLHIFTIRPTLVCFFFFIPCGPTGQIAVELWGHLDGGPVERPRGKVSRGRPLQTSSTFSEKRRACHGRLKLPV